MGDSATVKEICSAQGGRIRLTLLHLAHQRDHHSSIASPSGEATATTRQLRSTARLSKLGERRRRARVAVSGAA